MTTSDDQTLAVLQGLLQISRDSVEGYATACRDLPDVDLSRELDRFRKDRQKITLELEQRIRDLRGDPNGSPSLPGAVHRTWMDLESGGAANPTAALLIEVERGEMIAVDAFRQALKDRDVDATTRKLFERHYELVQTAHDRVRQLRDRLDLARSPSL